MTTTPANEPFDGNVMFTDINGTLWNYRRSAAFHGPARQVFVYMHDFRAHLTSRYLEDAYGPCLESLAQMHDAMCWAETGVKVAGL